MKRFCTLLVLILAAAFAPSPKALAASGINDTAKFFSADAEKKATQLINTIAADHHGEEVYVETLQAVPDGQTYPQFAEQRTRAAKVNGVYLLIIRKGGHVHVAAAPQTSRLFTNDVRTQLASQIEGDLRKGPANFDTALINGLNSINDTFTRGERQPGGNLAPKTQTIPPPTAQRPTGGGGVSGGSRSTPGGGFLSHIWGWVCLGIGVWIVFALIRSAMSLRNRTYGGGGGGFGGGPGYGGYGQGPGPGYGYGGGGYGGGGGGGWGSSLLGGLFGAAAGNWLYDRFARGSSYGNPTPPDSGGYGQGPSAPSSPDWVGPGDTSQGYESSDAGGGADFGGGGGGGGGDFGGGDAGGGGDFGGGGGGDFGGGGGDAGGGGDFA